MLDEEVHSLLMCAHAGQGGTLAGALACELCSLVRGAHLVRTLVRGAHAVHTVPELRRSLQASELRPPRKVTRNLLTGHAPTANPTASTLCRSSACACKRASSA